MSALKYLNIEYDFQRRRYGCTSTMQFYTWLMYRGPADPAKPNATPWETYGDPWPKVRLNRTELNKALADILTRVIKPGARIHTVLGDGVVTGASGQPGCIEAQLEGFKTPLPVHANSIIKVKA